MKLATSTMHHSLVTLIVLLGHLVGPAFSQTRTIKEILEQEPHLNKFRKAGMFAKYHEGIFADPSQRLTVFAPKDEVLSADNTFMFYLNNSKIWHINLQKTVDNHIIDGEKLDFTGVMEYPGEALQSKEDILRVNKLFNTIESGTIEESFEASNGYVHVVSAIMEPQFYKDSFREMEILPELGPDRDEKQRVALTDVVDFLGVRDMLNEERPEGRTHVACRIRAFNRMVDYLKQTINWTPDVTYGEFMNATFRNESIHNFIEYNLIDKLYYDSDYEDGYEEIIMASNGCAHMFVTKHEEELCFNDACMVIAPEAWSPIGTVATHRKRVANNGMQYAVTKCLVCPGIAMLTNYAAEMTKHGMKDVAQFFISSEWNLRNLSMNPDVGDGGPITLFAATDSGWGEVTGIDTTRLSTDMWKPHQLDFLRNMMIQGNYTMQELKEIAEQNGGSFNLTTLANQTLTLEIDRARDKLMVNGGDIFVPDLKGVDGHVHFITKVPLARSVTHSVYDIGDYLGNYYEQLNLIDSVYLRSDMRRLEPLTAVFAPDHDWRNKIIDLERIEYILENHLFEGLLWCDYLLALESRGERIESLSGQEWGLSVNEFGMPCFDSLIGFTRVSSCVTECDHLARNGIVLIVDQVILSEEVATRRPTPPLPPGARPPRPKGIAGNGVGGLDFGSGGALSFSRPKRLYTWEEADDDPEYKDSSASTRAALFAAALPFLIML